MSHGRIVDFQVDDDEVKMRRSLGLDTASNAASAPSMAIDPLRGARQAIWSQATAREYAERRLAHAEATIADLQTKLHHARREKDTAMEAARAATARIGIAQRTLVATEAALSAEKSARERGDRTLRDAQETIRDVQNRLDAVGRRLEEAQAELAAERQARQDGKDVSTAMPKPVEPVTAIEQKRPSPMPGNHDVSPTVIPAVSTDRPEKAVAVVAKQSVSSEPVKKSVGRPRKAAERSPTATTLEKGAIKKVGNSKQTSHRGTADGQEPVQWWVAGWKTRRT